MTLGTRAKYRSSPGKITVDRSGSHLVMNDEVRTGLLAGDGARHGVVEGRQRLERPARNVPVTGSRHDAAQMFRPIRRRGARW